MITNIYFVRHAEPDYSIHDDEKRPLSNKGELDAQKVADFFKDKSIEVVLSSPYKRALDTVKPLAENFGLRIETIYEFRERKVDDCWVEDFIDFSKKQWENFNYKLSNGESLFEVQSRNITALNATLKKYAGKNIIVGSHGTSLSTIINYYDPNYSYDDFERIISIMPWIVKFTFENNALKSIIEIDNLEVAL